MATRLLGLIVLLCVVAVGAFLGSALSQWFPEAAGPAPRAPVAAEAEPGTVDPTRRIRVEVLNAAGTGGLARRATDFLRERGFDVVYFGNADTFGQDSTLVLDRVDRLGAARAVADSLGVRQVLSEPDSNLYLDVTVRLGLDWEPPPAPGEAVPANPAPEGGERWWDIGRLWRTDPDEDPEGGG